jgi:D-glycero-beta-D-manno-heptose 1-phosphate adenylyltransferase
MFLQHIENKILTPEKLTPLLHRWRFEEQKIVFTNGCFDVLHAGHIQYLAQARSLGNQLIVGLNSDASVRRLKGKNRPINDEKTRSFVLAALEIVSAVVIFEEDTPLRLIETILPNILVKGGDYTVENIVGAQAVIANGGEVKTLSFLEGYSTTNVEQKILLMNKQ